MRVLSRVQKCTIDLWSLQANVPASVYLNETVAVEIIVSGDYVEEETSVRSSVGSKKILKNGFADKARRFMRCFIPRTVL